MTFRCFSSPLWLRSPFSSKVFFFNDTATTEIYTLSLHDALPISCRARPGPAKGSWASSPEMRHGDRKSTRLNSSHTVNSYAVFCLKKKKDELLVSRIDERGRKEEFVTEKAWEELEGVMKEGEIATYDQARDFLADLCFEYARADRVCALSLHGAVPI